MSEHSSNTEPKMGSDRSFGLVFAFVFAVIAFWPVIFGTGGVRTWALVICAVFLVLAFASPKLLAPLNRVWFKFGLLLGSIVAPIVMLLIFFLTVVPIGLLRRMRNPDPLKQRIEPEKSSYWVDRSGEHPQSSMFKQY